MTSSDNILSVSDITRAVQHTLEDSFGSVVVRGEISNFVNHSSGHRYFSLKDSNAQLKAVMWRSSPLRFTPANGMSVIARGKVTMYAPQGAVQLECRSLEPLGAGDLQLAFEALKRELYERGWFDAAYKKPLPRYPTKIGVATSPTGAAVRDVIATLARRMPAAEVVVRPTLVQGDGAAEDIARAIAELNATDCDVLIVGRGGGSIEDLWAFNTEIVAEAIFSSVKPIISAVGHEIDFTIADFVADVRAATPTAAAEIAVRDQSELWSALQGTEAYLHRTMEQRFAMLRQRITFLSGNSALPRFPDELHRRQQRVDDYQTRMNTTLPRIIQQKTQRLDALALHLASLHPYAPLNKGFTLLERAGCILTVSDNLNTGDTVKIIRKQDRSEAHIQNVEKA
ncbi:MAG: exodeoxyribonuclease VII large subunit [Candidatus Kapabacteria bacterium]|nr:exodeoxyribonuclease VII large subunit [Candidatus Kapabacteria bacterium]